MLQTLFDDPKEKSAQNHQFASKLFSCGLWRLLHVADDLGVKEWEPLVAEVSTDLQCQHMYSKVALSDGILCINCKAYCGFLFLSSLFPSPAL